MYEIQMRFFTATEDELDDVGMNLYECYLKYHKDAQKRTVTTLNGKEQAERMFSLFPNQAVGLDHDRLFDCQVFLLTESDHIDKEKTGKNRQQVYHGIVREKS